MRHSENRPGAIFKEVHRFAAVTYRNKEQKITRDLNQRPDQRGLRPAMPSNSEWFIFI